MSALAADPAAGPVVFVCGRNAVRSPMAEALWRARFGEGALSCGVAPAAWPDGFMIAVMSELGADLADFECRGLDALEDFCPARVISVAVEADAQARALADRCGVPFEAWPVDDPTLEQGGREARLDAYRAARDAIQARIAKAAAEPR